MAPNFMLRLVLMGVDHASLFGDPLESVQTLKNESTLRRFNDFDPLDGSPAPSCTVHRGICMCIYVYNMYIQVYEVYDV